MIKKNIFLFIVVSCVAGCAAVPFQETPLVSLGARDPWATVEHFRAGCPESFQLLTTVVFEYNGRTFPGVGVIEINTKERAFRVAGLNPMGVKLFEISGNDRVLTTHYAIAAVQQYGDFTTAVGNDIRRIYFDLIPSPHAPVWKRTYQFIYRQYYGRGYLEYVFAGQDGDLIEKRYYEDFLPAWSVSYYEYRVEKGKRYPRGIVFVNYQYGYRLIVRQKELLS